MTYLSSIISRHLLHQALLDGAHVVNFLDLVEHIVGEFSLHEVPLTVKTTGEL